MNKICFFLFCLLSVIVIILNFSRIILDFNILQHFYISNQILLYIRTLSLPNKLFILIVGVVVIIFLLRGFLSYLNSLNNDQ